MKNWKRRYFQLDENTIGYFKSELVRRFVVNVLLGAGGSLRCGGSCRQCLLSVLFSPGEIVSMWLERSVVVLVDGLC